MQSRPGPANELAVAPRTSQAAAGDRARGGWMKIAIAAVAVVLLVSGVLLFMPRIVHDRIVSSARESGVELTIERVGLGASGVALRGVHAKLTRVPNVELAAEEIYSTGFSARDVRVRGLDVTITGPWQDTGNALARFYEETEPRIAGTAQEPRHITVVAARVTWNDLVGPASRLSTTDAGLELESKGVGLEEIRGSIGHFEIATKKTTFGPWAASFERNPSASRLRVSFDPPVPDGPSALYVYGTGVSPRLTVRIPRSPIARLGVRPSELGLPADPSTEVEVKLEVGQAPSTRIEASGRIDLFAAQMKGIKGPLDIKIEGNANGMPGKPLELEKTTAAIGPFTANITGTILPADQGIRLDAAWRTVPIACEKLARAEAKSLGGSVAVALQDLAKQAGFARVTGTATASGIVKYDSKTPDDASVTFATRETCGLQIFGK